MTTQSLLLNMIATTPSKLGFPPNSAYNAHQVKDLMHSERAAKRQERHHTPPHLIMMGLPPKPKNAKKTLQGR